MFVAVANGLAQKARRNLGLMCFQSLPHQEGVVQKTLINVVKHMRKDKVTAGGTEIVALLIRKGLLQCRLKGVEAFSSFCIALETQESTTNPRECAPTIPR
jgi:hypothetical protein